MNIKTVRFSLFFLAIAMLSLGACEDDTGSVDLVSLTISHLPNKLQYDIGESADWTGLEIMGAYTNGSTAVEVLSSVTISGFDSVSAGTRPITVSKGEKTAVFSVTVTLQPGTVILMGLTISSLPTKLVYALDESADWTGLEITGIYTDGSTALEPISDVIISGFDSTTAGVKTITVSKDEKTAIFTVTVSSEIEQNLGKGTGGITIVPLPEAGDIAITITNEITHILEASTGYTGYQWVVDGIGRAADSPGGRTITLDPAIYGAGQHRVLVLAYKNGVPYTGELRITL